MHDLGASPGGPGGPVGPGAIATAGAGAGAPPPASTSTCTRRWCSCDCVIDGGGVVVVSAALARRVSAALASLKFSGDTCPSWAWTQATQPPFDLVFRFIRFN